jgi:hypothetical protein
MGPAPLRPGLALLPGRPWAGLAAWEWLAGLAGGVRTAGAGAPGLEGGGVRAGRPSLVRVSPGMGWRVRARRKLSGLS